MVWSHHDALKIMVDVEERCEGVRGECVLCEGVKGVLCDGVKGVLCDGVWCEECGRLNDAMKIWLMWKRGVRSEGVRCEV